MEEGPLFAVVFAQGVDGRLERISREDAVAVHAGEGEGAERVEHGARYPNLAAAAVGVHGRAIAPAGEGAAAYVEDAAPARYERGGAFLTFDGREFYTRERHLARGARTGEVVYDGPAELDLRAGGRREAHGLRERENAALRLVYAPGELDDVPRLRGLDGGGERVHAGGGLSVPVRQRTGGEREQQRQREQSARDFLHVRYLPAAIYVSDD